MEFLRSIWSYVYRWYPSAAQFSATKPRAVTGTSTIDSTIVACVNHVEYPSVAVRQHIYWFSHIEIAIGKTYRLG